MSMYMSPANTGAVKVRDNATAKLNCLSLFIIFLLKRTFVDRLEKHKAIPKRVQGWNSRRAY